MTATRQALGVAELSGLFAIALAVRVVFVLAIDGPSFWPGDDNRHYFQAALDLLSGEGLPVRWSPLLPALEAAVAAVVGPSTLAARLLTSLLGALAAPLTALLALRWAGREAALIAGLLACLDGYLVASSARALSEAPFITLLVGALLAFPRPVATGLLLGLACLARPTGPAYAVAAALALLLTPDAGRAARRLGHAALLLAMVAACLLPWVVHQRLVTGRFVLTTIGGGSTLLGSNCEETLRRGESWIPPAECGVLTEAEAASIARDPVEGDRVLARAAVRDLAAHPERWPRLLVRKLASFWGWGNEGWSGSAVSRGALAAFMLLLPFAVAGAVWTSRRRAPGVAAAWAFVAVTLALALVFWGGHRMRLPIQPVLIAWAAVGVVELARRVRPASRLAT